jgi:hypothetical protein
MGGGGSQAAPFASPTWRKDRVMSVLAINGHRKTGPTGPFRADTVAKVFLRRPTQIFRAVRAAIE